MRGGLDRLQKELDTLTYNSRSVLNALIRSTVSGGSSNGYTVTRAGIKFVLTRVDIYRLYKFYQAWEVNNFESNTFDTIRLEQDKIPVRDESGNIISNSTTNALIAHSKILYYIASDSLVTNDSYWLTKIQTADNPKLVSNFAPIPLNLRTPTFDENMSTKEYSQYETYLFPASYYSTSIFGYQGDDTYHYLNGKSWTISTDEYISLDTYALATGKVNSSASRKTKDRRNYDLNANDGNKQTFSSNFGYDTHSRGMYSIAGGVSSIVTSGAYAGIAIGNSNIASNVNSASIGGSLNIAASTGGSVLGGNFGIVTGDYGAILGGIQNVVGAPVNVFTANANGITNTECIVIKDGCESSNTTVGVSYISIVGDFRTSYLQNDIVRLFDFTYTDSSNIPQHYYALNGDGLNTVDLVVDSVSYDVKSASTRLIFTSNLPPNVSGGSVSRFKSGSKIFGYASTAMGYNSIASGMYQTVVGTHNYALNDKLFIVGNGSSYIRSNVMEVRTDGIDIYGVSYPESQYVSTDRDLHLYSHFYLGPTTIYNRLGGSLISLTDANSSFRTKDTASSQYIGLFVSGDGSIDSISTGLELKTSNKPMVIRNSEFDIAGYTDRAIINSITIGSAGNASLISGDRLLLESNNDMYIFSSDSIGISWSTNLNLYGNTFGALPTNNIQMPHLSTRGKDTKNYTVGTNIYPSNIAKAGFYEFSGKAITDTDSFGNYDTIFDYVQNHYYFGIHDQVPFYSDTEPGDFTSSDTSVWSYNMLNIAGHGATDINDGGYHLTQLYFPYSNPDVKRNIIVQQGAIDNVGNWLGTGSIDELAYRSDVTAASQDMQYYVNTNLIVRESLIKTQCFDSMAYFDGDNYYTQLPIGNFVGTGVTGATPRTDWPIVKTRMSKFAMTGGMTVFKCAIWFYGTSILSYDGVSAPHKSMYHIGETRDVYFKLTDVFANELKLDEFTGNNSGDLDDTQFGLGVYSANGNSNYLRRRDLINTVTYNGSSGITVSSSPYNGTATAGLIRTKNAYDKINRKWNMLQYDSTVTPITPAVTAASIGTFWSGHLLHIHFSDKIKDYFGSTNTGITPKTDIPWIVDFTFIVDSAGAVTPTTTHKGFN